jgi:hypothetical protein
MPMRNAARIKMGYYPLPKDEAIKVRSLLSYSDSARVIDPCVGQGDALCDLTSGAEVCLHCIELDAECARIASSKGFTLFRGITFDAIVQSESFSLAYLNPPCDSEIGSIANRRIEAVSLAVC